MKEFRLVLYDENGMQVYEWDVAWGVPSGVGWNLSLREGRTGLMAEILGNMIDSEKKAKP